MYYARAMILTLKEAGFDCFSGMAITGGGNCWKVFMHRLKLKDYAEKGAKAKVLTILQTQAFYKSMNCLKEVCEAVVNGVTLLPIRLEANLPQKREQWKAAMESDNEKDNEMCTTVRDKLAKINSMPAGGLLTDHLVSELPRIIQEVQNMHGVFESVSSVNTANHDSASQLATRSIYDDGDASGSTKCLQLETWGKLWTLPAPKPSVAAAGQP